MREGENKIIMGRKAKLAADGQDGGWQVRLGE